MKIANDIYKISKIALISFLFFFVSDVNSDNLVENIIDSAISGSGQDPNSMASKDAKSTAKELFSNDRINYDRYNKYGKNKNSDSSNGYSSSNSIKCKYVLEFKHKGACVNVFWLSNIFSDDYKYRAYLHKTKGGWTVFKTYNTNLFGKKSSGHYTTGRLSKGTTLDDYKIKFNIKDFTQKDVRKILDNSLGKAIKNDSHRFFMNNLAVHLAYHYILHPNNYSEKDEAKAKKYYSLIKRRKYNSGELASMSDSFSITDPAPYMSWYKDLKKHFR